MNNKRAVQDILKEYERDRQASEKMRRERVLEIHNALPRVREIDSLLETTAFKISKIILSGNVDSIKAIESENRALIEEKAEILRKSGFPSDYMEMVYKCPVCKDTGYVNYEKCSCFTQKLVSRYYNMSSLGDILDKENFDNFDFRFYSDEVIPSEGISARDKIQAIYQLCMEFVSEFGKRSQNLFFYGKAGRGKTFMCNCIAKDILDMGKTVLYSTAGKLFKTIEDARFNRDNLDNPDEQVDFFYSVDLLIIDDLGTEFSTQPTRSALFDILNSRIIENKPTIISSNLAPKDLENQYSDRIVSRLQGEYFFCKFIGEDIRILKKTMFRNG